MTKTARTPNPASKRSSSPDESSQDESGRPPSRLERTSQSSSSAEYSPTIDPTEDTGENTGASISKHIRFDEEAGPNRFQTAEDAHLVNLVAMAIASAFANRDAEKASRRIGARYVAQNVSTAQSGGVTLITPMLNPINLAGSNVQIGILEPNSTSNNSLSMTDNREELLNNDNIPNTPPSTVIDRKVEGTKYRKITGKSIEDSKLINVSVNSKNGIQLVKRIYNVIWGRTWWRRGWSSA